MYERKEKSGIIKLTVWFFGAMVLFTLLSRAVWQHGTAVVSVAVPSDGVVTHSIRLTGKALQNQDLAVTTVGGLRVAGVQVNEGQQVAAGDVLFTLDIDDLTEQVGEQKREMEKQKLSIQDAWSRSYAAAQQRGHQQTQAQENYASAVARAETALERAARTLERAKQKLEDFYNGVSEEERLTQALEQAKADWQAAQSALEELQAEVERRVAEAVAQASTAPTQPLPTEDVTLPTEDAPLPTENEPIPPETEPLSTEEAPAATDASTVPTAEPLISQGTVPRLALLAALSPEPTAAEAAEAAVREAYAPQLADAQEEVERTKAAMEEAREALERFQSRQGEAPSEQVLLAAVEQAQDGYDDALAALESTKLSYGQAVRSAQLPDGSDHTAQIGQLTYDQMALRLKKLEALLEEAGQIRAPVDGLVTGCYVQTGRKTTDEAAMLLADLSRGCKFSGRITEEQSAFIGVGDLVTLRASGSGKLYADLPVTLLAPGGEGMYQLTVQLPENTLALGAGAELTFTRRSQRYGCCVPLSALHLDEKNQPYVLVAEEVKTVLGTQTQARKMPVAVVERGDSAAALEDGSLSREQRVIVSADRAIGPGSRVRVA